MLFNWLYARHTGGDFLLRIEDTDTERNRPELIEAIFDAHALAGPRLGRRARPPVRSLRCLPRGRAQLVESGAAYVCDCTPDAVARRAKERGGPPGYDGYCRDRGLDAGRRPCAALPGT